MPCSEYLSGRGDLVWKVLRTHSARSRTTRRCARRTPSLSWSHSHPSRFVVLHVKSPAKCRCVAGAITGVWRLDSGDRDRPGCSHAHPGARPRRSPAVCSASGTTPHAIPRGPWVTTARPGKNDANVSNPLAPIGTDHQQRMPPVRRPQRAEHVVGAHPTGDPACSPPPSPPSPLYRSPAQPRPTVGVRQRLTAQHSYDESS
jgi:hypothetical protein